MAQPQIVFYNQDLFSVQSFPVGSSDTIEVGDFVLYDGTDLAEFSTTATNDATFIGIANGASLAGETMDIPVLLKCIIDCDLTSATYKFGAGLKNDGANENTLVADSDANTIAWFWEHTTATITRGRCHIDTYVTGAAIGKCIDAALA